MNGKTATIQLPWVYLKPLYRHQESNTLVCEVDVDELKKIDREEGQNLEEVLAKAEIDYATGNYQTFNNTGDLKKYLHS